MVTQGLPFDPLDVQSVLAFLRRNQAASLANRATRIIQGTPPIPQLPGQVPLPGITTPRPNTQTIAQVPGLAMIPGLEDIVASVSRQRLPDPRIAQDFMRRQGIELSQGMGLPISLEALGIESDDLASAQFQQSRPLRPPAIQRTTALTQPPATNRISEEERLSRGGTDFGSSWRLLTHRFPS